MLQKTRPTERLVESSYHGRHRKPQGKIAGRLTPVFRGTYA
jgi:hypothetical protein